MSLKMDGIHQITPGDYTMQITVPPTRFQVLFMTIQPQMVSLSTLSQRIIQIK